MENKKAKHDKNSLFIRVPKRVVSDKNLTATDRAVLVSIGSWINDKNDTFHMSRPDITERAGLTDLHTIDLSIKTLEHLGYLRVKRGGKGSENYYTVIFNDNEAKEIAERYKDNPLPRKVVKSKKDAKKSKDKIAHAHSLLKLVNNRKKINSDDQENEIQSIYDFWIECAKEKGLMEFSERKNKDAILKLLERYTPDKLKKIITFFWNVWVTDNIKDKAIVDIGLFNSSSYHASIFNQYTEFTKELGFTDDDFKYWGNDLNYEEYEQIVNDEDTPKKMTRIKPRIKIV